MLPDDVIQVRTIPSALQLPSQVRSSTRLRPRNKLEDLQKVDDTINPATSNRDNHIALKIKYIRIITV